MARAPPDCPDSTPLPVKVEFETVTVPEPPALPLAIAPPLTATKFSSWALKLSVNVELVTWTVPEGPHAPQLVAASATSMAPP